MTLPIALLTEFIGTFIFVSVILITGNPILIALSLLIVIYLGLAYSGSNFNPAVSTAMYFKGTLSYTEYLSYIGVQLTAGFVAYYCYKNIYKKYN